MEIHLLENSFVKAGVTAECGHLFPVLFNIRGKYIEPLNVSPWYAEETDPAIPPMLKMLRGDFFCAPFGNNDLNPEETRAHGASANETWKLVKAESNMLSLHLTKKIMGADVIKNIYINEDEPVIYQEHIFSGGIGKLPLGHHLMLKSPEKLYLSFSPFLFGETPPLPVEPDPSSGNSILQYPQHFRKMNEVKLADGRSVDISRYPFDEAHEDIVMLKSDENLPFAWSAAAAPENGWLWFALKDPRALNSTLLWMSNGGRKYSPWLSRHTNVIGIEEVTSFFHLGHKASVEENHLNKNGYKTFGELKKDNPLVIRYIFGLTAIPADFTYVKNITESATGIIIEDVSGIKAEVKVDLNFITNTFKTQKEGTFT
jgi:hypothetical protein